MLAAIALAFVGCSKEIEIQKPEDDLTGTHTLTFKVEKAADTRTSVVEGDGVASYFWTEGDEQYFHIYENGKEATEVQMSLSSDNKVATFKATFADTDTTAFSYTAVYGSDVSKSRNPLVPNTQKPVLDSFDPAADVLVSSEPISLTGNTAANENTTFTFKLKRVVSVNKMTLKGLAEGEVIQTVELISSDQYFSSRYGFESGSYTGDKKALTFDYTSLDGAKVGEDFSFPVYFTSAPVTSASFSVRVTTDKNVYLRDNFTSKLTLEVENFRRFGINLSGYSSPISAGVEYQLVSSQSDLENGAEYLIVGNGKKAMSYQKDNNRATVDVTPVNNIITIDNTIDAYVFKLDSFGNDNYSITDITEGKETEGQYLYAVDNSHNYLRSRANVMTNSSAWTITVNEGVASIVCCNTDVRGVMCLNGDLISCYASLGSYKTLALYKRTTPDTRQNVTLSFRYNYDLSIGTDEYNSFTGQTVTITPDGVTGVKYSFHGDAIGTVDENSGVVTLNGTAGTASVSASFSGDSNYKPAATVAYRITVVDPSAVDHVTLDWTYPTEGAATSAGISAIPGVTASGLGTDYAANNSPYCIKLDGTGDYILVKTDDAIGEVSVGYKMIGGANTSTLNILESSDGETFTPVEDLPISGSQNSTGIVKTTHVFNSISRYVKINFTKGSNVGIGSISILKADDTPQFSVESPLEAAAAESDYTVNITRKNFTNAITVSVPDDCDWIVPGTIASGAVSFNVHVNANTGNSRTATLTLSAAGVTSQELVVNQAGVEPGTEANPYSVSDALAVAGALDNNATTPDDVYVSGIISKVETYYTSYKSITYYISDDGSTNNQLEVYSGKGLNGADFTDITNLAVGDQVTVKGKLKNYNETLEFNQTSQIVDITYTTRYTVTLGSVSNGTIATSSTSVGAQGIVTLSATPANGYELDKWTVTNSSSGTPITVSDDNTFIMPASNVNVTASFKEASLGSPVTFMAGTDKGETSVTKGGVTVTMTTMNNDSYYQAYKGQTMSIVAPNGKKLTSIVITCTAQNQDKYGPGCFSTNSGSYSYSSYTGTWTGQENQVTFTASLNQVRVTKIVVTYE